jgi:hypothetical protein
MRIKKEWNFIARGMGILCVVVGMLNPQQIVCDAQCTNRVKIPLSFALAINDTLFKSYACMKKSASTQTRQASVVFCNQSLSFVLSEIVSTLTLIRQIIAADNALIISNIDVLSEDITIFNDTVCSKLMAIEDVVETIPQSVFDEIATDISLRDLVLCTKLMELETKVMILQSIGDECALLLGSQAQELQDELNLMGTILVVGRIIKQMEDVLLGEMGE